MCGVYTVCFGGVITNYTVIYGVDRYMIMTNLH